jgi:3-isopropylmalate/(R)-2-methylmalate dehydratase large subunit
MEFTGPVIDNLEMDQRITMANMAIEAGAKSGIFGFDEKTREWLAAVTDNTYEPVESDPDAHYEQVIEFDVSNLKPLVALPHLPSNVHAADEVGDMMIHQVVIGSCTNGRLSDLRDVARILKGHQVHPDVRCIVIPGSQEVAKQATKEGLADVFMDSGAIFSTSTCGPCLGGYMGVIAKGERCVSTTNRNFRGRMGHREAEIILAGPQVAAASAILGRVGSPEALNGN